MAVRTVSNAGGGWNSTLAWVGGVVPIAGDTVNFTATSGPFVVNVSTATLIGIDFTNYVNTITFNQPINTNGTVNLGTGGYTQAGTSGLIINGATTISGTTTWSNTISFTGTTYVITLSNTLNITGQVTFSQTGALSFSVGVNTFNPTGNILVAHGITTLPNNFNIVNLSAIPSTSTQPTLNGSTINISGNLTLNSSLSGMFLGGTTNLVLNGTGTWSHSGTAMQLRNNLTINTPSTITISGAVYYNTGTLTYTGGTVTTTGSTLNISVSTNLNTNGISWNTIAFTGTTTITLLSNLTASLITCGNFPTINGNTLFTNSISVNAQVTGTTTIQLTGTGTWTGTTNYISNNLNINCTSLTITGSTVGYRTGTLTYNGGTVTTTGSTLSIGASTTLNTVGMTWNNITISATATLTLSSNLAWTGTFSISAGNTAFAGVGTMSGAALTITTANGTVTLNNNITCTGLVTLGTPSAGCTLSSSGGTRTIITSGGITNATTSSFITCNINIKVTGGTITSSGNPSVGGYYQVNTGYQFEIDGNVTFASTGAFYMYGGVSTGTGGTFKYTSGTVTTTGSSFYIHSIYVNSGTITWNNAWFLTGGATTSVLQSDMTVNGLLTLGYLIVGYTINNDGTTRTIIANGGITMSGSTSVVLGTANIRATGGIITGVSSVQLRNNLELAGNVTFASGVTFSYNTGTLLYTSGTITTTNSTIAIGASTTLNTSGVTWANIVINATATITLSSNLAWSGTFSITAGNTTFSGVGVMTGAALTITTSNGIVTLNNDITCTGLVTLGVGGATGCTLSSSGGTRTIITSGGLTNATTTSLIIFNVNIRVTGGTITSSGSLSGGYYQINTGYQFEIAGNVAFSASTFYIYGGVSTGTGGTFKYTSGVVTTTGSFIWVQALNFNPGSIQWNNVWFISGSASTTVLQSDVTVNGLLTLGYLTIGYTINNDATTRTIFANNGITMSGSTSVVVGTANIRATGGTITGVSSVQLRNNLELAGNITFANGVTFNYNTGTLLYTSGSITTTNSGLSIATSTTLNTLGIIWNNIVVSSGTLTLPSNLVFTGTLTVATSGTVTVTLSGAGIINSPSGTLQLTASGGNLTLTTAATHNILNYQLNAAGFAVNSSGTWNVYGNLIRNGAGAGRSATGTVNLIGTGSVLFNGGATGALVGIINITTLGTITFGSVTFPNVYYEQSTLTYNSGTVDATNCTLLIGFTNTSITTTLNTSTVVWKNITLSGTNTVVISSVLNISGNLTTQTGGITINGLFNVNVGGNLAINITTSGTSTINLNGTVNQSWTHGSAVYLGTNLIINKASGTLTLGANVYYQTGAFTYTAGTVDATTNLTTLNIGSACTLSTNPISWYNLTTSFSGTITLTNNLTWTNLWSVAAGSPVFAGAGAFTPTPTSRISFTGSAAVTTPGTILSYNFLSITISTAGLTILTGNLLCNLLNLGAGTTSTPINGSGGTRTITTSGGITMSGTGSTISGTVNIIVTGGTITGSTVATMQNNLTLNGNITFASGTAFFYNSGTLTYTPASGTITTTGSTLGINGSVTLNTIGVTWNAISWTAGTITLSTDLTATGVISSSNVTSTINGGSLYANGGITYSALNAGSSIAVFSGTSTIRFEGTGSWTSTQQGTFRNNVIINPTSSTFTIFVYYAVGTITYSNTNGGKVTSAQVVLGYHTSIYSVNLSRSATFNTNVMVWDYIYLQDYTNTTNIFLSTITCSSNLHCRYFAFGNIGAGANITQTFNMIGDSKLLSISSFNVDARSTLSIPHAIVVDNLYLTTLSNAINNFTITVRSYLYVNDGGQGAGQVTSGTTALILEDNVLWSGTPNFTLRLNMNIKGRLRILNAGYYNTGTITYIGGSATSNYNVPVSGTLNLTGATTLINCHKILFNRVVITSGVNITMNEFFSGSPKNRITITSTAASNYSITLTDRFEKFSRFVKVSRATMANPGQLTVITDKGNQGNNIGIKFAPNQLANGVSKNRPSGNVNSANGLQQSYLVADPALS